MVENKLNNIQHLQSEITNKFNELKLTTMKSEDFFETKLNLVKSMTEEYKANGFLFPKLFMVKDNVLFTMALADGIISTPNGQAKLVEMLKELTKRPKMEALGVIFEADFVELNEDTEENQMIKKGLMSVSESSKRKTTLSMVFSTPTSEVVVWCEVDEQTKAIGNPFVSYNKEIIGIYSGIFSEIA